MRRDSILMIWIGGVVLAVFIYAIGPDRFLGAVVNLFDTIDGFFRNIALILGTQAYGVVRALTIAFWFVFAVLCVLASRRGLRSFWPLVIVTGLSLLLVWRPYWSPAPISHWVLALVLVLVGAVTMTQRLTARPPGPPPFPPGRPV